MPTQSRNIALIGAPLDNGAGKLGCRMGAAALRISGIQKHLEALGHTVTDLGNVEPASGDDITLSGSAKNAEEITG